ncbi:MAG TPA: hypothetical protein VL285_25225, partial [Bryobacteraceae bacterium]|nr:hypothetical protein [Bryobacteraceae bacterium]
FGAVTPALGAADIVLDQPRGRLYLINSNLNRVQVYSIAQRTFLASITTGTQPLAGAMSPDGRFLYVTCYAQASLNVIDLDRSTVTRRVGLPANPEGVAVGIDGKALITTIGTGQGNQFNTLLIYDPNASVGAEISVVVVGPTPAAAPIAPPLGRSALSTRSALLATPDKRRIIGVNNSGNTRSVFVYEVASATILRARTFNFVSNVLSISPDASKFMAGLTLFETDTLTVLAQQNAANAPFSFPGGNANNFNTQQNQGGSVFAPDGSTLYSAFNIAPVQNPPARANVSRFLLNDPDNLLITLGLQLPENLSGKMVISSDGQMLFALSESGFLTLPVGTIYNNPIAMPDNPVVLLSNDQCGLAPNKRVTVGVNNAGRGRLTASAQLLQLPNAGPQGLGGFGGPGGGGPGGTIVIVLPPVIPGLGGPAGVQGAPGNGQGNTSVLQTSPQLQTQITPAGANLTFQYNSVNTRTTGTITPHDFLIQSPEAINIPPNIRIFQNNFDSDARAAIMPLPLNSSSSEGLFDMITDPVRQRLYIANSGMNRVEVFDMRTKKFMPSIKVGQLPHSLALGTDGVTMYVANSGSETISILDLDKGAQVGLVRFTPLPFNSNVALVTPNVIASGLRGPQVIMSNGSLWRVVGNQVLPRALNPSVFGTARTITGPAQTMASTPNGEFIFLLSGNGVGYLYDASVDDWVAGRTLFGNAQSNLPTMTGYYGPIAAGPRGQYFLANGVIFNQSLTQIGSVAIPPTNPNALPTRGGAQTVTAPPVAAVAAAGNNTFVRFSQPVTTNANQVQTQTVATPTLPQLPGQGGAAGGPAGGGPGGGLAQNIAITAPTIEMVDVNTGNTLRVATALEGPLARVNGNQTMRISGRTLAVDAAGTTAYALTTSGLSVIPLDPVLPADRPVVNPNGVTNLANKLPTLAPGSLAAVFGRNLASKASVDSGTRPTILGGACVTLNNVPLPLLMTSDQQINVQIPPTLAAGRYPLVVRSIDRRAASVQSTVTIAKVAPVVFMDDKNNAAIYHSDGRPVTRDEPAKRDEPLSILATGLGVTKGGKVTAGEPSPSNPLAVTGTVNVYFGSPQYKQSEMIVEWSGLVPGLIGVYQINVRVPGFHSSGKALPVTVRAGGVLSPSSGPTVPVVAVD